MGSQTILPLRHGHPPPATAKPNHLSPMRLFLFRRVGGGLHALSADPRGRNLPRRSQNDPWAFVRRLDILPGEIRVDLDPDAVLLAVGRDGYALIDPPHHAD